MDPYPRCWENRKGGADLICAVLQLYVLAELSGLDTAYVDLLLEGISTGVFSCFAF